MPSPWVARAARSFAIQHDLFGRQFDKVVDLFDTRQQATLDELQQERSLVEYEMQLLQSGSDRLYTRKDNTGKRWARLNDSWWSLTTQINTLRSIVEPM